MSSLMFPLYQCMFKRRSAGLYPVVSLSYSTCSHCTVWLLLLYCGFPVHPATETEKKQTWNTRNWKKKYKTDTIKTNAVEATVQNNNLCVSYCKCVCYVCAFLVSVAVCGALEKCVCLLGFQFQQTALQPFYIRPNRKETEWRTAARETCPVY